MGVISDIRDAITGRSGPVGTNPGQWAGNVSGMLDIANRRRNLSDPNWLNSQATAQAAGLTGAIRNLGAQEEEAAGREVIGDITERGIGGGGYETDRVQFARGRVRGKTELDVQEAIARERARIAGQATEDINRGASRLGESGWTVR